MMWLQAAHSALHPASVEAKHVGTLYNFMAVVAAMVCAIVIVVALWGALRGRRPDEPVTPERESRAHRWILGAVTVTVAILFVTLVYDLALGRSMTRRATREMLSVRVTGHQWWWEIEYEDPTPQNRVHSANELHLPVGRPVALKLASADVIHSFWAPNLGGKKDLIPGHHNELYLTPTEPGIYQMRCAEFCGLQHAYMALAVVVEDSAKFARWLDAQRQPALSPADTLTERGRLVFETGSCATCHAIAGTNAHGTIGPDLSHVASRRWLASGRMNNTRANLAGWIVDPQRIKPGVLMPSNALEAADLQALVNYIASLR